MEEVSKADKGRIAEVAHPIARVFGQVQRQRPVRPEQPEEVSGQAIGPATAPGTIRGQGGRRETHGGLLTQPDRIVRRAYGFAEPLFITIGVLQPPQGLVEPKLVGLPLESGNELYSW